MSSALNPAWQATLDDYPTALAASRDGSLIAAGTASGKVFVFDASAGDLLHTPTPFQPRPLMPAGALNS